MFATCDLSEAVAAGDSPSRGEDAYGPSLINLSTGSMTKLVWIDIIRIRGFRGRPHVSWDWAPFAAITPLDIPAKAVEHRAA
jgi:hypothetical protein